ncbi:MAG: hypothetical protein JSV39_01925 [Candidatus Aenigmatarchaeota archaeon]|nr:MAG: hypothetical protein JSV39_01925 [Candidatus Aenigmarchaeota archaeon]
MVKITMDHSAMIFYHRHPVIQKLRKFDEDKEIRLYHAINLDRDLETMNETEGKMYERLREMVFGREQKDLNLTEHGDIMLLVNHMKNKRDFFLTLEKEKYKRLEGHRDLRIRFPDNKFLKEVRGMVKK